MQKQEAREAPQTTAFNCFFHSSSVASDGFSTCRVLWGSSYTNSRKAPQQQLLLILAGYSTEAGFKSLFYHNAKNQESNLFKLQLLKKKYKNGLPTHLIKLLTLKTALYLHSKFWYILYSDYLFCTEHSSLILTKNRKKKWRKLPENHLCPKSTDRTNPCPHHSVPQELWGWGCLQELLFTKEAFTHLLQPFCGSQHYCQPAHSPYNHNSLFSSPKG